MGETWAACGYQRRYGERRTRRPQRWRSGGCAGARPQHKRRNQPVSVRYAVACLVQVAIARRLRTRQLLRTVN